MNNKNETKETALRILITQKLTPSLRCAYARLENDYDAHVTFQGFTEVSFIPEAHFRVYKPLIAAHTAFLFTNRIALDGFFQFLKSCNIILPPTTLFFLTAEKLVNYLSKYVEIKKRKVMHGRGDFESFLDTIIKYKKEKFLFPCSNLKSPLLRKFFKQNKYHYKELPFYSTGFAQVKDLDPAEYDIIVFYSPFAVNSFNKNFPKYGFAKTKIAAFGEQTLKELTKKAWPVSVKAPTQEHASMVSALVDYLDEKESQTANDATFF